MKSVKHKGLTLLLVLICAVSLIGCGPQIKANGGVAVEQPFIPPSESATEGDVGVLLIQQQSALKACNANF